MDCARLKTKVEECIRELEAKSRVEFVSVFAKESHSYLFLKLFIAAIIGLVTSLALIGLHWKLESPLLISLVVGGSSLATWFLLEIPSIFRLMAPDSILKAEVEEAAQLAFLREGVFETAGRTGILIYVSQLEHAVFVMADSGLLQVIPHQEWKDFGIKLAKAFQRMNEEELFLLALRECSQKLEPHFPVAGQNRNELSDQLRRS